MQKDEHFWYEQGIPLRRWPSFNSAGPPCLALDKIYHQRLCLTRMCEAELSSRYGYCKKPGAIFEYFFKGVPDVPVREHLCSNHANLARFDEDYDDDLRLASIRNRIENIREENSRRERSEVESLVLSAGSIHTEIAGVYFIESECESIVKIGKSRNVKKRLLSHAKSRVDGLMTTGKLKVVRIIQCNRGWETALERTIHGIYRDQRSGRAEIFTSPLNPDPWRFGSAAEVMYHSASLIQ